MTICKCVVLQIIGVFSWSDIIVSPSITRAGMFCFSYRCLLPTEDSSNRQTDGAQTILLHWCCVNIVWKCIFSFVFISITTQTILHLVFHADLFKHKHDIEDAIQHVQ